MLVFQLKFKPFYLLCLKGGEFVRVRKVDALALLLRTILSARVTGLTTSPAVVVTEAWVTTSSAVVVATVGSSFTTSWAVESRSNFQNGLFLDLLDLLALDLRSSNKVFFLTDNDSLDVQFFTVIRLTGLNFRGQSLRFEADFLQVLFKGLGFWFFLNRSSRSLGFFSSRFSSFSLSNCFSSLFVVKLLLVVTPALFNGLFSVDLAGVRVSVKLAVTTLLVLVGTTFTTLFKRTSAVGITANSAITEGSFVASVMRLLGCSIASFSSWGSFSLLGWSSLLYS